MVTKLTTLMKTKFGIEKPHELLRELKTYGKIGHRSLRHPFEDTPKERFDVEVIKKYIQYVSNYDPKMQYDPIYWMYRTNISYEDAVKQVEKHKKNKCTSKESFIKRHGEEIGLQKFEKFQRTSAYSNSDEWFKKTYGENWKNQQEYEFKRRSKRRVEYWLNLGYSEEESKNKVSEYQLMNSGVHRKYYENRGYTEDEIDVIISEIRKKTANNSRNTKYLKEKYPDTWREIYKETSERYRKRMEELGLWMEIGIVDDFKKYRTLVNKYTNESLVYYGDLIENLELRSRDFQLDHKYSIKRGYLDGIAPEIIGSLVNLEILPRKINLSKREKCSITKKQLLKMYKNFKENHENQVN